ncbi:hypothetical protein RiCNE_02560 [Rickettsia endosymbiont of Culicoides newsteadi]|nr:hypothetical protein RiCNE_02560 [Rickettsia endosymbiont of Culicoides newsteadi]
MIYKIIKLNKKLYSSYLLTLRMAFKSHIENSLASLREATLVATKQSICGLPRSRTFARNDVLYFSEIFKLSWGLCVR